MASPKNAVSMYRPKSGAAGPITQPPFLILFLFYRKWAYNNYGRLLWANRHREDLGLAKN